MKSNIPVHVILGTDKGHFRVAAYYSMPRKKMEAKFPANKPKQVLDYLFKVVKKVGKISNVMNSSSMDFPEEEGVTRKQVDALYKVLCSDVE